MLTDEQLIERFNSSYVPVPGPGCWLWTDPFLRNGYGLISLGKDNCRKLAHRFSYEMHISKGIEKLVICHKCDTPSCVNPDHLFAGTQQDNLADMVQKKRHAHGSRSLNSKLNDESALAIFISEDPLTVLAKKYGVSIQTICNLKHKRSWTHATTGHDIKVRSLPDHGTITRYGAPYRCRCDLCKSAKVESSKRYRRRRSMKLREAGEATK